MVIPDSESDNAGPSESSEDSSNTVGADTAEAFDKKPPEVKELLAMTKKMNSGGYKPKKQPKKQPKDGKNSSKDAGSGGGGGGKGGGEGSGTDH